MAVVARPILKVSREIPGSALGALEQLMSHLSELRAAAQARIWLLEPVFLLWIVLPLHVLCKQKVERI